MSLTKVVCTPCVFELMSNNESEITEFEHLSHLQEILEYIQELNVEFDFYEEAPYYLDASRRPPISRYHYQNILCSQIYHKIQRKIAYSNCIELGVYDSAEIISEYDYPFESETKAAFLKYITYLYKNTKKFILFIGKANSLKSPLLEVALPNSTHENVVPIYRPNIDCSGQLGSLLPQGDKTDIFPNKHYCSDLNSEFVKTRDELDRMSLIMKYGREAASRNGYIHDSHLSYLNSRKQNSKREVFGRSDTAKYYLSLDFESGGFEVFDHSGTHLGQFSFDGTQVKCAQPRTHKLYFS